MTQSINTFSLISRLFGNLFYRAPNDPILDNVFVWLQQNGLNQVWGLETDKESDAALISLQAKLDRDLLAQEYQKLFGHADPHLMSESAAVNPNISAYGISLEQFAAFRKERGAPDSDNLDHFALLLLTSSWLEDNVDSVQAQRELFSAFLLPCAAIFLARVKEKATLPFYRSLAHLTLEILAAMSDELDEAQEEYDR